LPQETYHKSSKRWDAAVDAIFNHYVENHDSYFG
jgi:hypothetical protein